jgi:hypothetical protein
MEYIRYASLNVIDMENISIEDRWICGSPPRPSFIVSPTSDGLLAPSVLHGISTLNFSYAYIPEHFDADAERRVLLSGAGVEESLET